MEIMKLCYRFLRSVLLFIFSLTINLPGYSQKQTGRIEEKRMVEFTLSIYLPPGYDTLKSCKVLYFNDGQTVFGEYGLHADEMADELIKKKLIEPIIIVGIHSDAERTSNYIPYFDVNKDGSFRFFNSKDLSVKIIYKKVEKMLVVNSKEVEEIMKN